jgi:hypothetical protein
MKTQKQRMGKDPECSVKVLVPGSLVVNFLRIY